jgi:uncharacterized protein YkwD
MGAATTTNGGTPITAVGSTTEGATVSGTTGGVMTNATSGTSTSGGMTMGGTTGAGGGTASSAATTSTTGANIPNEGDRSPEGVCARWNADRANMSEGTWSGSLGSCDAGDISAEGRENALRLFNLYRWLAELPPVTTSPERDEQAQACALMMDANNSLSHDPPDSWTCYTEIGAQGASTSNISSGPGVQSVDGYMVDNGNESTHGHRRIILSNRLGPIGLGSTGEGGSSCMQNIGGEVTGDREWTAWPAPGAFPIQAYAPGWGSLADTGWSLQSEDIDLGGAQVTITSGGSELEVNVSMLDGNYGYADAIRIVPSGWDVEAGQTYSVSVTGIDTPITYDIQFIDCE